MGAPRRRIDVMADVEKAAKRLPWTPPIWLRELRKVVEEQRHARPPSMSHAERVRTACELMAFAGGANPFGVRHRRRARVSLLLHHLPKLPQPDRRGPGESLRRLLDVSHHVDSTAGSPHNHALSPDTSQEDDADQGQPFVTGLTNGPVGYHRGGPILG